jgi:hypothetical protein
MAADIQSIVDVYNAIDPAFSFTPIVTVVETATVEGRVKRISVEVDVTYNTKNDRTPLCRHFTQTDTSSNAFMEGRQ